MHRNQHGFAHLGLILLLIVVLAVVGFAGWKVFSKNSSQKANTASSTVTKQSPSTPSSKTPQPKKYDENTAVRKDECKSNPNATFSHDFSEPDKISIIIPPKISEAYVRDRAWLAVDRAKTDKVAIYAPADVDATSGVYKVSKTIENIDYDFWFQLSCERWFFINHVSEPVDKLRKLVADTPQTNETSGGSSATANRTQFEPIVHFQAGELLGYATGTSLSHQFDLGVFDANHQNQLPANYQTHEREKNFICSFDLFPDNIKAQYYAILARSPKEAGSVCPQ